MSVATTCYKSVNINRILVAYVYGTSKTILYTVKKIVRFFLFLNNIKFLIKYKQFFLHETHKYKKKS